ncbi:MAG TPA: YdcF family protein, partial [Hyphomicrobiaceae bacterium]|nr:YdcF family protein [Hyphomicrobiaceae bacterium]
MMLWVQKIVGFLLQPSTLVVIALVLALKAGFQLRPRAARRWTMAALGMMLVFGLSPLGDLLLSPLEKRFPRPDLAGSQVDGIIVLGGSEGVGSDRALDAVNVNEAAERLIETAILARRFPGARIAALGGGKGSIVGTLLGVLLLTAIGN